MDEPIWRPLPGGYEIAPGDDSAPWGRIRRNGENRAVSLLGRPGNDYPAAWYMGRPVQMHRLILMAHVGPPPAKGLYMECCHNDDNRQNNRLSNIEWNTHYHNERMKHNKLHVCDSMCA